MTIKNKIAELEAFMDEQYPNVGCELKYNKDYELVIAVMLSAQTTDVSVNKVTPILFNRYKDLKSLSQAKLEDLEDIIHSRTL